MMNQTMFKMILNNLTFKSAQINKIQYFNNRKMIKKSINKKIFLVYLIFNFN